MSTSQNLPTCNLTENGVGYYTSNPGQLGTNRSVGMSGVITFLSSSIVFFTIGLIAYSSRGFDIVTIILFVLVFSSCIGALMYYNTMTTKPSDMTRECTPSTS